MTYGINVFDPDLSLDPRLSTDISQRGLVIDSSGTSDVVEIPPDALIAIQAPSLSSSAFIGVTAVRDNLGSGNFEYTFREIQKSGTNQDSLGIGLIFGTTVTVNYIVLRSSDNVTPTGSYGFQVKDGSQVQFDSRNFETGKTVTVEYNFVQGTWFDLQQIISYSNANDLYFFANWFGHQESGAYPNGQGLLFSNDSTNYGDAVRIMSYQTDTNTSQRSGLTFGGGVTIFEIQK